jgi:oxygen-independent coproporphyrinogen-3 oxidase
VADLPLRGEGTPFASPAAAYVHVPFCFHKCHYCDFYSLVDRRDRGDDFVARLGEDLAAARPYIPVPLETIFVGGGTPSLLGADRWRRLGPMLRAGLPLRPGGEFTVEANPETVTAELIAALAAAGVNRISIGCQSFDPRHLETLERWHDPANVERSVSLARAGGIEDVNLDLIFAIPGQSESEWRADLARALALAPTHVSCYCLSYEAGTPLRARLDAGGVQRAGEDLESAMFDAARETLGAAGFEHYEISNWARPGRRCRHNVVYWEDRSWWALGPGAAGHAGGWRWRNAPSLDRYLETRPLPPITDVEAPDDDRRAGEGFMLGLRLRDGIPLARVAALLALGVNGDRRAAAIRRQLDAGLLEERGDRLRLSDRGVLLGDTVMAALL